MDGPGRTALAAAASGVREGRQATQDLLAALLAATVFCEAPPTPGLYAVPTPDGPVVPVFSDLAQLAAARGAVAWLSLTGQDLLDQLPPGLDLVLDPAGPAPVRLRSAALRRAVHVA